MDEFIVVKVMNEATIRLLKSKGENCDRNIKVKEYLQDEAFFFKTSQDNAYKVLTIVGVKSEQLEEIYRKLITSNVYYSLLRKGKINPNDEKLKIKYY